MFRDASKMAVVDWRLLADRAASTVGTPCYLISEVAFWSALEKLVSLETSVRLRHWLSLKTQPVPRLLKAANELGLGIEVVSEQELVGVLGAGVPAERILVNGIAKHVWMPRHRVPGLSVHFDSLAEVGKLAAAATDLRWRVGLRCAIPDPEAGHRGEPPLWNQFGMSADEVKTAAALLAKSGCTVEGLHFHLHTNVRHVNEYRHALQCVSEIARGLKSDLRYIDIGGGLPVSGEEGLDGSSAASTFDFAEFREWVATIPTVLPSVGEVWMENGRFLMGPSGALVVTVCDRKERPDATYLICDGGRVNHARMASTETHRILLSPRAEGRGKRIVVCGPTCTTVDRLGCWMLPESVKPGDRLIWLGAGAYHIPLETRFSTGLAPVVWFGTAQQVEIIRARESPSEWWSQWAPAVGNSDALVESCLASQQE